MKKTRIFYEKGPYQIMHIVIFTHPDFTCSQSMPRFAKMIAAGMSERNHCVEIWTSRAFFFKIPSPSFLKKWLGYIDQFIIFPVQVRRRLKKCPATTLFVFTDQALGLWMPLLKERPFVVHCHDFLAQRSALGEIPENPVGLTGRIYQRWIRNGYRTGKNFISVSNKTRDDLHSFLLSRPRFSKVIYNGLNQDFKPGNVMMARKALEDTLKINLESGFLLHVGGNQFYKNRIGVLRIYWAWRKIFKKPLPILMVGAEPDKTLVRIMKKCPFRSSIHFITNPNDSVLKECYQGAKVLLFPSLGEGFGWPIAEAMASGCPVITTGVAPMTEVGGKNCYYLPLKPLHPDELKGWEEQCAEVLQEALCLPEKKRDKQIRAGIEQAKRFNTEKALNEIEKAYAQVLETNIHSI